MIELKKVREKFVPTVLSAILSTVLLTACNDSNDNATASFDENLVLPQAVTPAFSPSPAGTSE